MEFKTGDFAYVTFDIGGKKLGTVIEVFEDTSLVLVNDSTDRGRQMEVENWRLSKR